VNPTVTGLSEDRWYHDWAWADGIVTVQVTVTVPVFHTCPAGPGPAASDSDSLKALPDTGIQSSVRSRIMICPGLGSLVRNLILGPQTRGPGLALMRNLQWAAPGAGSQAQAGPPATRSQAASDAPGGGLR
jgi:hypothetical protein